MWVVCFIGRNYIITLHGHRDSSHTYRSSTSTKGQTLFLLHQVVGKKHLNTYSSLGRDTGAYFLNSVVLITVSYIVQSSVI